jgi:hypothetical protein
LRFFFPYVDKKDTDSCILACSKDNFYSLVKKECRSSYDKIARFLFQDEEAEEEQSCKLKIEGVWTSALFRTTKAYRLDGPVTEATEKTVIRMRSVSSKRHKYLEPSVFGQDPRTNTKVVQAVTMRPSMAGEVNILKESKFFSHCLNFKRRALVSRRER